MRLNRGRGAVVLALASACTAPRPPSPAADAGSYETHLTARDRVPANLGTDFWAVSTVNALLPATSDLHFAVVLSNPGDEAVTATIAGGTLRGATQTVTVPPRDAETVTLPWVRQLSQNSYRQPGAGCLGPVSEPFAPSRESLVPDSALVRGGAYRIHASAPIAVYQYNPVEPRTRVEGCEQRAYTSDGATLLPVASLGQRYLVLTHPASQPTRPGFVAVVGDADGTEVRVVPAFAVKAGPGVAALPARQLGVFTLNRGDVLQLLGETAGVVPGGDLSGTTVEASAPVALFAGVDAAEVGETGFGWQPYDRLPYGHLEEQLPPEPAWGSHVVAAGFPSDVGPRPYQLRVVASRDGTELTARPPIAAWTGRSLRRGEVVAASLTGDVSVDATAPVLAMQSMIGFDSAFTYPDFGAPSMALVPWTEQYRTAYGFAVPSGYATSVVSVVAADGARVWLDGAEVLAPADRVADAPWAVRRVPLVPGEHLLWTDARDGAGVVLFCDAASSSVMVPVGLSLRELP